MRKRFLSLFMALCLTLTAFGLPAQVFAADQFDRKVSHDVYNPETQGSITITFNFDHPHMANMYIKDTEGNEIAKIFEEQSFNGNYEVYTRQWDGKNNDGEYTPDGEYHVAIEVLEERWKQYNDIEIPFQIKRATPLSLDIAPALTKDVFMVYGNFDESMGNIVLELRGDVELVDKLVYENSKWYQMVQIGDENTHGYAEIDAYRIPINGAAGITPMPLTIEEGVLDESDSEQEEPTSEEQSGEDNTIGGSELQMGENEESTQSDENNEQSETSELSTDNSQTPSETALKSSFLKSVIAQASDGVASDTVLTIKETYEYNTISETEGYEYPTAEDGDSAIETTITIQQETGLNLMAVGEIPGAEHIGQLRLVKHRVKTGDNLKKIAESYYSDAISGIDRICTKNEISATKELKPEYRLLIMDPEEGVADGELVRKVDLKYSIELLFMAGVFTFNMTDYSKDPVNLSTGNFLYVNNDLKIDGAFPLTFMRFYNAIDNYPGITGYNWHNDFDISLVSTGGNSKAVVHEDGHWEEYKLDENANFIPPDGVFNELIYEKNEETGEEKYTLIFPDKSYYEFNGAGLITSKFDTNGNETRFEYDGLFLNKVSTDSGSLTFTYNSKALVETIADNSGRNVKYEYADGNLIKFTDVNGNNIEYTYDGEARLLTVKNQRNNVTVTNTYDDKSRTTAQAFPDGGGMDYEYSEENVTVQTEQNGNVIRFRYDDKYRITEEEYTDGTIKKVYDNDNNLTSYTDKMGNTWTYEYDGKGNKTKETDPLGNSTSYEYNSFGKITKVTAANGGETSFGYDNRGNIVKMVNELDDFISMSYDSKGLLASNSDALANSYSFGYDERGNVISETDAAGNVTNYQYDNLNRVTKITQPEGNTLLYTYTQSSNIKTITDGKGAVMEYGYDAADNLTSIKDFNGNITTFVYNSMNHRTKTTDADGYTTTYDYDLMWNVTKATNENGNIRTFEYDSLNRLIAETDENGNRTQYSYDANKNITKSVDPLSQETLYVYDALNRVTGLTNKEGSVSSVTYDSVGNITKTTDVMGFETSYEYDLAGHLTKVTDALDGETKYAYDKNGSLTSVTDPMGYETKYEYNELNMVSTITNPLLGVTRVYYDKNGNISKTVDSEGGVTTYQYDANNRISSYVDPEGYTFAFDYDGNGNVEKYTDGRGNYQTYIFDALNRKSALTDEAGFISTVVYDPQGRITKYTDAEGAVTSYVYDNNGNVTAVTDALGNSTSFVYDALDRLTKVTDARGGVTSIEYNPIDKVAKLTDAEGGVYLIEYDKNGNLLKETNPENETTTYEYNELNQVTKLTDPLGHSVSFTYDANSRITTVTDKNGNVTDYTYDGNGNVIKTTDALGNISDFSYDTLNRLTALTLHRIDNQDNVNEDQATLYEYDGRSLVTKVINAKGDAKLLVYDGNGNLIQKTDEDGYVTKYGYEPRNLVDKINYSDKKQVTFAYNKVGELVTTNDWEGTTTFEVDLLKRITGVNDHLGKQVGYAYDEVGNQTAISYPDSSAASYVYDLLGRITEVTDGDGKITAYDYDKASRLIFMDYPNYRSEEYEYDAMGQLLNVIDVDEDKNKDILYQYSYDPEGNALSYYKSGIGIGGVKEDVTYKYDELNRLTEAHEKYGKSDRYYTYDSLGNLTYEQTKNNKTVDYIMNVMNQLVSKTVDKKDVYDYTYDKRGNLIEEVYVKKNGTPAGSKNDPTAQYVYDETNRMVKGTNEALENSIYNFNGLGVLVNNTLEIKDNSYGYHKMDAGTETPEVGSPGNGNTNGNGVKSQVVSRNFVLDYTAYVPRELMEFENEETTATMPNGHNEGLTYRYTYGLERLSANVMGVMTGAGDIVTDDNVVKLYFHNDRLGSTRYATGDNDKIMAYTDYDEWGNQTQKQVLKMSVRELDLTAHYATHNFDPVITDYYAKARLYSAADKRFLAQDPIKDGLNWYTYCWNNPVNYVDFTGLVPKSERLEIIESYFSGKITSEDVAEKIFMGIELKPKHNYTPLHEIAQVFAAVAAQKSGFTTFIEYAIPTGDISKLGAPIYRYADIVGNRLLEGLSCPDNRIWEIKPMGASGDSQLKQYTSLTQFWPGSFLTFEKDDYRLLQVNTLFENYEIYMKLSNGLINYGYEWETTGEVFYSFYMKYNNGTTESIKSTDVYWELQKHYYNPLRWNPVLPPIPGPMPVPVPVPVLVP